MTKGEKRFCLNIINVLHIVFPHEQKTMKTLRFYQPIKIFK